MPRETPEMLRTAMKEITYLKKIDEQSKEFADVLIESNSVQWQILITSNININDKY